MTMTRPAPPSAAPPAADSTDITDRLGRGAALLGALAFLPFGAWAILAPQSFFERVAEFHPYNEHFIQDIGGFQLGLGAVLLIAAARPAVDSLTVALLGAGAGAAAHAVSHMVGHDLGGTPATDIPLFSMIAVLLLAAGGLRARAGGR